MQTTGESVLSTATPQRDEAAELYSMQTSLIGSFQACSVTSTFLSCWTQSNIENSCIEVGDQDRPDHVGRTIGLSVTRSRSSLSLCNTPGSSPRTPPLCPPSPPPPRPHNDTPSGQWVNSAWTHSYMCDQRCIFGSNQFLVAMFGQGRLPPSTVYLHRANHHNLPAVCCTSLA